MKALFLIVSFGLAISFLALSCSREESPEPPPEKKKIVKPIPRPPERRGRALAAIEQGALASKGAGKAEGDLPNMDVPRKKGPEKTEASVVRPPKEVVGEKEQERAEDGRGYYVVKGGESLSSIAAREDVLGDPLLWPVLYRLNRGLLNVQEVGLDLPEKKLPGNTRLKVPTPTDMAERARERTGKYWVVNILSAEKVEELVPVAIELMNNGYVVYITSVKVKNRDFFRLRVGFFATKEAAEREGKKIVGSTRVTGFWVVKIGQREHKKYIPY